MARRVMVSIIDTNPCGGQLSTAGRQFAETVNLRLSFSRRGGCVPRPRQRDVMHPANRTTSARPFIRIGLWILILVSAMLLPFLPGRHDPLAATLAAAATGTSFGSLLLVPIGVVWLTSASGYGPAMAALVVAAIVSAGAALVTAASGSIAAAAVILAASVAWLIDLRRHVALARASGAAVARSVPIALIVVPLVATAARIALVESAAVWSRDRAIANTAAIISDIERFRERTGAYPVAINSVWPDYPPGVIGIDRFRYEPSGEAYNLYFEHPSTDLAAREIVMYNPRGEQDFSSHALDLLQLSPERIRQQRGYFASQELPQAKWRRFLFD